MAGLSRKFDGNNDSAKLVAKSPNKFKSDGAKTPWGRIAAVEAAEVSFAYTTRIASGALRSTIV